MNQHIIVSYLEGEIALVELPHEKFDLILMDVELAGEVGGLQVVRQLRTQGIVTPIVAVTAYAMLGDREKCLAAGCNEYLPKPLPISELIALLARYDAMAKQGITPPAPQPVDAAGQPVESDATPAEKETAVTPAASAQAVSVQEPETPIAASAAVPVQTPVASEQPAAPITAPTPASPTTPSASTTTPAVPVDVPVNVPVDAPPVPLTVPPITPPAADASPVTPPTTANPADSPAVAVPEIKTGTESAGNGSKVESGGTTVAMAPTTKVADVPKPDAVPKSEGNSTPTPP